MKIVYIFLLLSFSLFAQQRIPKEFLPLQKIGEGSIKNPYWKEPSWKVWSLDSSSVKIESGELKGEYKPIAEDKRLFPEIIEKKDGQYEFQLKNKEDRGTSGLWDDVYLSQDAYHTRLHPHKDQYLVAGKTTGFESFDLRHRLGVNFTSQSYARRGRHIVDDFMSTLDVERNYFFANTVRCTPSHISFRDNAQDAVEDTYDALYSHSYQSIGQSGSEMHAIYKMMYAASFIPRKVKDKLKKNGLYATAVLNLFKASLPYVDSKGNGLSFEHEMRHKAAYSSHGTPQHPHYCSANPHFHGYNDNLHLAEMVKLAKSMNTTPPITVFGLGGFALVRNGKQVRDQKELQEHLKMMTVTNLNIWCKAGETALIRVNLNKSFDLNGEKLSYIGKALYPNQKNVEVKKVASGVFDVQIAHDPKLPKGRIPVIFTTQNESGFKGNPVFLNLYWPDEGELPDYHHFAAIEKKLQPAYDKRSLSKKKVTVNKRPQWEVPFAGNTIFASPGESVKFPVKAVDPEGKGVIIYRRSGEIGNLVEDEFTFSVPEKNYQSLYKVHFHFSDGTGGYSGKMIQIAVSPKKNQLQDGWIATCFQSSKVTESLSSGSVIQKGNEFTISNQTMPGGEFQALFVSRVVKGAFDLILKSEEIEKFGLQFSTGLDHYARQSRLFFFKGNWNHYIRKDEAPWGIRTYKSLFTDAGEEAKFLRMVSDGKSLAAYFSKDGSNWKQISGQDVALSNIYGGFLSYGSGNSFCEIIEANSKIPLLVTKEKIGRDNTFGKVTFAMKADRKEIYYTLDNSKPSKTSLKYEKPFEIKEPGLHTVRALIIDDGKASNEVQFPVKIKSK